MVEGTEVDVVGAGGDGGANLKVGLANGWAVGWVLVEGGDGKEKVTFLSDGLGLCDMGDWNGFGFVAVKFLDEEGEGGLNEYVKLGHGVTGCEGTVCFENGFVVVEEEGGKVKLGLATLGDLPAGTVKLGFEKGNVVDG